jgi:hypothetical protein
MLKIIFLSVSIVMGFTLCAQEKKTKVGDPRKKPQPLRDVKSREIVTEFNCIENATVFLENFLNRVNIVTSNERKIKLVTTIYYQGDPTLTDVQWFEKLQLSISGTAENVVVKSGHLPRQETKKPRQLGPLLEPDTLIANAIPVWDSSGHWVSRKSSAKKNVILYIPADAKLDLESKYADITVEGNLREVKAKITNAGLTMGDAEKLFLVSDYGRFYSNNIITAEAKVNNGTFHSKNLSMLDINSCNSTVDLGTVKNLIIKSLADEYDIDELGIVNGRKDYGEFSVISLHTSLDITGKGADIKIRNIKPTVTLIKLENQYADIRLPVSDLKDYAVKFEGKAAKVYSSFEKLNVTAISFNAVVGNGRQTSLQLKCNNCMVDFK